MSAKLLPVSRLGTGWEYRFFDDDDRDCLKLPCPLGPGCAGWSPTSEDCWGWIAGTASWYCGRTGSFLGVSIWIILRMVETDEVEEGWEKREVSRKKVEQNLISMLRHWDMRSSSLFYVDPTLGCALPLPQWGGSLSRCEDEVCRWNNISISSEDLRSSEHK